MRMIVACLLGAAVIGLAYEKALQPMIESAIAAGEWQKIAIAMGAAFLGALFGWAAKGIFTTKKS